MLYHIDKGFHHEEFAKDLRKRQTFAERIMWAHVRAKRWKGCKFRRQVPVGPYIIDFLCVGAMLVIEIDGSSHALSKEYDRVRDDYLRSWGFTVLRFSNDDVLYRKASVFGKIAEHL